MIFYPVYYAQPGFRLLRIVLKPPVCGSYALLTRNTQTREVKRDSPDLFFLVRCFSIPYPPCPSLFSAGFLICPPPLLSHPSRSCPEPGPRSGLPTDSRQRSPASQNPGPGQGGFYLHSEPPGSHPAIGSRKRTPACADGKSGS